MGECRKLGRCIQSLQSAHKVAKLIKEVSQVMRAKSKLCLGAMTVAYWQRADETRASGSGMQILRTKISNASLS